MSDFNELTRLPVIAHAEKPSTYEREARPLPPVPPPEAGGLSAHTLAEIRELPAQFPQVRSAVMPALDLAQEELGLLTPGAMAQVAHELNLDPGYIEGVATFYTLFHLEPIGKHHLYVCTNLSCKLRGADEIIEHVRERIGVREDREVSADGMFSTEAVECLGACEYAPMMRLDHEFHYDLTPEKIDEVIAERRGGSEAPSHMPVAPRKRRT
jgi:NADH-quinone oxidoreductase subunit E